MHEVVTPESIEREADRIIRETLELFRTTHWTKNSYHRINNDGKHSYCAVGGLREVARKRGFPSPGQNPAYWPAVQRIAKEVNPLHSQGRDGSEHTIIMFNDHPKTELRDVLSVFERALGPPPPLWRRTLRRIGSWLP